MADTNYFSAKICAECSEVMPITETVCYCGGPIKMVRVEKEMKARADSYKERRWLYFVGKKQ